MAGLRFQLLPAFTGTVLVLLVSVQGWERINETQLLGLYQTGVWEELGRAQPTDDGMDFDDNNITAYVDLDDVVEGDGLASIVTSFDSSDTLKEPIVETEEEYTGPLWPGLGTHDDLLVDLEEPTTAPPLPSQTRPGTLSPETTVLTVSCSDQEFIISASEDVFNEMAVLASKTLVWLTDPPDDCGYKLDLEAKTLTIPFTGCHVIEDLNSYSLQILFVDSFARVQISTATCTVGEELRPRNLGCCGPTVKPTPPPAKAHNCDVAEEEQVTCGDPGISASECDKKGCCMDDYMKKCYYPMDECTADKNFVFAIRSSSTSVPVDPKNLIIPGHEHCKPVIVNDKCAIFKFKLDECGSRVYEVGEMKIYLAEVQTVVKALNLKFGIITRSDPLRFLIECRYSKCGTAKQSLASVGYMVKTPTSTLPSSIFSNGLYSVQLRIAEDESYSAFLPTYHQPLKLLLGKPVYLELRLRSPKPDAVILVNYCLAYPRSAKNALVLIFEGCANQNDPMVSIIKLQGVPKNRSLRRFKVHAFQFMEQKTNKYLNEEIYFMCSTEVCRPSEKKCEERCFDGMMPR